MCVKQTYTSIQFFVKVVLVILFNGDVVARRKRMKFEGSCLLFQLRCLLLFGDVMHLVKNIVLVILYLKKH